MHPKASAGLRKQSLSHHHRTRAAVVPGQHMTSRRHRAASSRATANRAAIRLVSSNPRQNPSVTNRASTHEPTGTNTLLHKGLRATVGDTCTAATELNAAQRQSARGVCLAGQFPRGHVRPRGDCRQRQATTPANIVRPSYVGVLNSPGPQPGSHCLVRRTEPSRDDRDPTRPTPSPSKPHRLKTAHPGLAWHFA